MTEKRKPRIYVAGALNADAVGYIVNCHKMIAVAETLRRRGYSVYVPCLDFLMGLVAGDYGYSDYFDNSQPWLEVSDAVFLVPGHDNSSGTKREIESARRLAIPVLEDIDVMDQYCCMQGPEA